MTEKPKKGSTAGGNPPRKKGGVINASARTRPRVHTPVAADVRAEVKALEFLGDVPLTLNMVLGKATMSLGEVLALETDSIVQLDKPSGEPVDIYVGDQRLGSGEVLVLHEKIRIRLLEVSSHLPDELEELQTRESEEEAQE